MCRRSFRTERNLRLHVERLHKVASEEQQPVAARVWCPPCCCLLAASDAAGHVTDQHAGRLHCGCCDVSLADPTEAADHLVSAHTSNYMCIVCLQMYSRQEQLIDHMNASHDSAPVDPEQPDASDPVAAVYGELVRRLETRARRLQLSLLGRTAVRCPYCTQTCSLHYLRTHLYKHKTAGFRCRVCEKRFKFPVSFQKHLLLHAGRADKCPHCDSVFTGRSGLRSHLRTHSAERCFACDLCQKRFKFKQTCDAHRRRAHGGGAAKVCHVCGAEFRLQYQLTVHLARHRNGRTLRCPLCPRLYELNLDLKRHLYSKHKLKVAEAERRFPEIGRRWTDW
ncbi:zinc finger protein 425-like [Pollicipes pollicipes]|uniref:zinc finger protein 425-like n=1 Tax=Pollicipes pollicipes TaxID=41117 RepID=UPI00188539C1|nr:zinc finger protein 425-like [Pollicipes pollicipes]